MHMPRCANKLTSCAISGQRIIQYGLNMFLPSWMSRITIFSVHGGTILSSHATSSKKIGIHNFHLLRSIKSWSDCRLNARHFLNATTAVTVWQQRKDDKIGRDSYNLVDILGQHGALIPPHCTRARVLASLRNQNTSVRATCGLVTWCSFEACTVTMSALSSSKKRFFVGNLFPGATPADVAGIFKRSGRA